MHSKADCVKLIQKVRASAVDPESAYLLRTRIKRSILSAARLAVKHTDLDAPKFPTPLDVPAISSKPTIAVIMSCNRLIARTRELCQPSEALDSRWRKGWNELAEELDILQAAVETLPAYD
jgi:hypothetical protein